MFFTNALRKYYASTSPRHEGHAVQGFFDGTRFLLENEKVVKPSYPIPLLDDTHSMIFCTIRIRREDESAFAQNGVWGPLQM
jgi:hypothetical protein